VVVLQNVLTKMLALPLPVSYTLPEVLDALHCKIPFQRKEYYHYPMGHGLRSEAIHAAWHLGKSEKIDELRDEARLYLFALRSLLWYLRTQVASQLFFWPPKFQLPGRLQINDPNLSRLAFFTRYESVVQCLNLRAGRLEPRPVQSLLGLMVELEAISPTEYRVVGEPAIEVEPSTFPSWLLARDTDAGRRAQLEFRDYALRDKAWMKVAQDLAMVAVAEVQPDAEGFPRVLRLEKAPSFAGSAPVPGERFQLHPRYIDYNTDRVIGYLEELDQAGEGLFVHLLRDPQTAARLRALPAPIEANAAALEPQLGLTDSQQAAFREIRKRKVVAVWGPPGTGKTHFLAAAILALAEAHARAGKSFRVLVTAFTHAAIENVLRKVHELQSSLAPLGATVALGKGKEWKGDQAAPCEEVDEKKIPTWLGRHPQAVIGATVYSCIKAGKERELPAFDLVVVDEASQVRVGEASVPVSLVAPEGRLVLAGDHLQLPPIVQGQYPEIEPGEIVLYRSIFEAVRSRVPEGSPIVRKLLENRRMNDVLTSFAAAYLYGLDYRCFDVAVAGRRLQLAGSPDLNQFASVCLDPAFPMVVVVLQGIQAAGENRVEASLVADLVLGLRNHAHTSAGKPYLDDTTFFKDGVFIVSPHRAQIRAIRRELNNRRTWTVPPFVDTVDKMQGQEADSVVISYGVSDPEYALREAEFIYSANRLNVAITRARTKSVVFLSEPLLRGLPQVLDSDDAAAGLAFMQSIVNEAERQGDEIAFDLGNGIRASAYRADCVAGPQA
jgi:hypothetical protein